MKIINLMATLVATTLFFGVFMTSAVYAEDEMVTLRWASFVSPKSIQNAVSVPAFAKAVAEASGGTLKIEHFPGGTLGSSPAQQLSMVENGVADIAEVVVAYSPGRFPELATFELPFLAKSNTEAGLAAWKLYEKGLLSDFDDLMLVGIIISGPYGVSTNKPVKSLADFSGLRLRAAGQIQNEIVSSLGAVPIGNISAPAIAESMSRGLIDGTLMAPGLIHPFRIADVAEHHLFDLKLGSVAIIFPMRRDTYEKLPPRAKAAFDEFSGEWITRKLGEDLDIQEAIAIDRLRSGADQGVVDDWEDASIEQAKAALTPLLSKYDTKNEKGVNLYRETLSAIEEVRSGN